MKKITLFRDAERYLHDLEELLPSEEEFLKHKGHQYTVSMLMMNIINACIDLGNEVINTKQLDYPGTYREVFTILEKEKVITPNLNKRLQNLVGLRNLLAHEYGKINMELLYEAAKEVGFIEEYLKKIIN